MNQPIQKPTLNVSPATVSATGTKNTAKVLVYSNTTWTAVSDQPAWCTVTPSSGTGNGTLVITYQDGIATPRQATILVTPKRGTPDGIKVLQVAK
jgi:hypothetical protein